MAMYVWLCMYGYVLGLCMHSYVCMAMYVWVCMYGQYVCNQKLYEGLQTTIYVCNKDHESG